MIYESADHRNDGDIRSTWEQLIQTTHNKVDMDQNPGQAPYEAIITVFKDMADRLNRSENTFNPIILIPMLEKYAFEFQSQVGSRTWVPDLFLDVGFAHETIVATLQSLWYSNSPPFNGDRRRRTLAEHVVYVCNSWYEECVKTNTRIYGSDENAQEISELLGLLAGDLLPEEQERVNQLRRKIQGSFR